MCESSVDSAFRNFFRAGVLKKRSRTVIEVPSGRPASSTRAILPPLISMMVPAGASAARVSRQRRDTEAIEGRASPRKPSVATLSRSSASLILEVAWRSKASLASSRTMPHPLSVSWMSFLPPASMLARIRCAPASSAFSSSSFTTEAGRSTTSPAAILLATFSERTWMRPMEVSGQGSGMRIRGQSSVSQTCGEKQRLGWLPEAASFRLGANREWCVAGPGGNPHFLPQKSHFSQRLREMGHPGRIRFPGQEQRQRRRTGVSALRSLLCVLHLFAGLIVDAEFLGYWLQRRIELHEGVLDCGVVLVTLPAGVSLGHGFGGFVGVAETEVSPLVGEAGGIFYFDGHAHPVGLKLAVLVDGAFALGSAIFHDPHGLLRPFAGVEKFLIGPARHEHVGKHVVAARRGAVVHSVAGGE